MSEPAVSVIVPAYKVTGYIAETLDSVLAQTRQDFEIIVVNDGCPDSEALERVLEPYQPRLVYIRQGNRGLSGARNTGIRAAKAALVALLDGDDLWEPAFLEAALKRFEADPELDMLWSDSRYFGETPYAGRTYMELFPSERPVTLEGLITLRSSPIASCVVARRQALIEAGWFDESLRRVEDFDMWLRLARLGKKLDFDTAVLGRRRIRADNLSADEQAQFEKAADVCAKLQAGIDPHERLYSILQKQIRVLRGAAQNYAARRHMDAGDFAAARDAYRRANQYRRTFARTAMSALLSFSPGLARTVQLGVRALLRRFRRPTHV